MESLIADLNRATLRRVKARRKVVLALMTAIGEALDAGTIREDVYDESYVALNKVLVALDRDIQSLQVSLGDNIKYSSHRRKTVHG
jgi:hypothetical protein